MSAARKVLIVGGGTAGGSARLGELEMTHASLAEHQAVTAMLGRSLARPI